MLRLLTTCVDAMGLMQAKIDKLEGTLRNRADAKSSADTAAHAEVAALQAKIEAIEMRMGSWLEAGVENATAVRADFTVLDDKVRAAEGLLESQLEASVRAAAAARVNFTALQERLDAVESGLGGRIDKGAAATATVQTQAAALADSIEGIRVATSGRLDAAEIEVVAMGRDLTQMQNALAQKEVRLDDAENRMARLEVRAQDFATRHADDIAAARTEAATWRMRAETDMMGFDQLSQRLTTLEKGLASRLEETTQSLAETETENVRIKAESRIVEGASERLRSRLSVLDSTIADQRARISCLQNKLAAATYAIRFEHMSRAMAAAGDHDILDLTTLATESLVSAA